MLDLGSSRVVAETCLPVKVFCGHVFSLVDECDYMFIPAIRSVEKKVYNCSKFLGLPDMTKAVIPECPPILDIDIDLSKGKRELYQSIYKLGRHFTWNPFKVKRAAEAAMEAHQAYQTRMHCQRLSPLRAMEEVPTEAKQDSQQSDSRQSVVDSQGRGETEDCRLSGSTTIAVIGHPYLLYDDYLNHRLTTRLREMGARVLIPETVSKEELEAAVTRLAGGAYWTYEEEVVGAGGYYLENEADGVIGIMAFGCGPDSLMMDVVSRHARRLGKPFMCLTLDEHTAETGLLTRLEAFLDMIQRRLKGSKQKAESSSVLPTADFRLCV
jgi:predicted nucleotide-binding protein (sugar kinase/HSP70/actin superfamily)